MPTPVTSNARAILSSGFAGGIIKIRGLMCADGVRRATLAAVEAGRPSGWTFAAVLR